MKFLFGFYLLCCSSTALSFWFETSDISIDHTRGAFAWKITKDHWAPEDEAGFSRFVTRMGEAVEKNLCRTPADCLRSKANPYHNTDPEDFSFYADCADWTYLLRAYYAWKNNLPFALTTMAANPVSGNASFDLRYTPYGNVVHERVDFVANFWGYPSAKHILNVVIPKVISTANLRTNAGTTNETLLSDFYPVAINKNSIRPGTTIYDPFGHVVVVYKVSTDGRIYFVDAHTDNTLTTGVFNEKYARANPLVGGGFKNWRPIRLIDYSTDLGGYFSGGRIIATPNAQLADFSQEQYFGNQSNPEKNWEKAIFKIRSHTVSFYDYVQAQLNSGVLYVAPMNEMQDRLHEICQLLESRVQSVESARQNKIFLKDHPSTLPYNIYVSEGEWETYSSPSRDTLIRILFSALLNKSKYWVELWKNKNPILHYSGQNLAEDLIKIYKDKSAICSLVYKNSAGAFVRVDLETLRSRLHNLSFDPYHCPELRWGASLSSSEGQSCQTNSNKNYWYSQEQFLRNQIDRRFDVRMNYRAEDLSKLRPGVGTANPPETDLVGFLNSVH